MSNKKEKKAPVIMVLSTKGGTGKSVISQQVLATYVLARHGESRLVELDDENQDSQWLKHSQIETDQVFLGDESDENYEAITNAISVDASGLIIDVGGNRTAKIVLQELVNVTSRVKKIDAVCIPVSDNRMGVLNAEKTLELMKSSVAGQELLSKSFIALNRVRSKKSETIKSPIVQRRFDKVVRLAAEWKLPVIIINDLDGIENLASYGRTLFEIAPSRDEYIEMLNKQIVDANDSGDMTMLKHLDAVEYMTNKATNEYYPLILAMHEKLDVILADIEERFERKSSKKEATV